MSPRKKTPPSELPPKPCPGCGDVLPRSEFYGRRGLGKCRRCQRAHRSAKGPDPTAPRRLQRAVAGFEGIACSPDGEPVFPGVDFMLRAQDERFPGRPYTALSREECRAVRQRAIELLRKAIATGEVAA